MGGGWHRTAAWHTKHGPRRPAALGPRGWGRVGGSGGGSPQLKVYAEQYDFGWAGAGRGWIGQPGYSPGIVSRVARALVSQVGEGEARLAWDGHQGGDNQRGDVERVKVSGGDAGLGLG